MTIIYHQPPNTDTDNENIGQFWSPVLGDNEKEYDRIQQRKCGTCFGCCEGESHPGWFTPGQVEEAAKLMDVTPEEFVDQYCVVDWIAVEDPDVADHAQVVQVFTPARVAVDGQPVVPTGHRVPAEYPLMQSDRCIFLNRDADRTQGESPCQIYSARPLECRQFHCKNSDEENPNKRNLAKIWLAAAELRRIPLQAFNDSVKTFSKMGEVDERAQEIKDARDD